MPACPRGKEYSSLSPSTTLNENDSTTKQNQLIDLLTKLAEKYRLDQQLVVEQTKQTDLLLLITRYIDSHSTVSNDDRRNFLQAIISTSSDLLTENDSMESPSSISIPIHHDDNTGDLSLDDLTSEYLRDELPSTEIVESKSTATKIDPIILLPISIKSPLDSILFSDSLSSQTAADDAETIWKSSSSSFGQIFCTKTIDVESEVKIRTSNCLFDRSLYERLTRLIDLLPKQCPITNNSSSIPVRIHKNSSSNTNTNLRPAREFRGNPNRPNFRPDFPQQNDQTRQRHPPPSYSHSRATGFNTYHNANYQMNSSYEPQGYYHQGHRPGPHQRHAAAHDPYFSQRDPQQGNNSRPRQPNRRGPRNNNNPAGPKFSQDKSGPTASK